MRILASITIIFFISFLSLFAFAATPKKVLLISDIDDTIKSSHVLSKVGETARVANVTVRFNGMAQLYQLIVNENPSSTKIVYLSNAPKKILGIPALQYLHQTFLSFNRFPPGEVDLRESIFEKDHKIKEIRRLLINEKPDVVIMIGDNGENDAAIYRQATLEFANQGLTMVSFIHQLYSTKPGFIDSVLGTNSFSEIGKILEQDQTGFVTPIEIALQLNQQGLLGSDKVAWMVQYVAPVIVKESYFDSDAIGAITFPSYMNCTDFKWQWPETAQLLPLIHKIRSQCK